MLPLLVGQSGNQTRWVQRQDLAVQLAVRCSFSLRLRSVTIGGASEFIDCFPWLTPVGFGDVFVRQERSVWRPWVGIFEVLAAVTERGDREKIFSRSRRWGWSQFVGWTLDRKRHRLTNTDVVNSTCWLIPCRILNPPTSCGPEASAWSRAGRTGIEVAGSAYNSRVKPSILDCGAASPTSSKLNRQTAQWLWIYKSDSDSRIGTGSDVWPFGEVFCWITVSATWLNSD